MSDDRLEMPRDDEAAGVGLVPFIARGATDGLLRRHEHDGATIVQIDAPGLTTTAGLVLALQAVLPFPPWCGPSTDSMRDAFRELVDGLPFPIAVALRRFDVLATANLPLAGQLIYFGTQQMVDFALERKQFRFYFSLDG